MTSIQPSRLSNSERPLGRRFERATRFLALAVGAFIVGYALWLLTVGVPVQVESFVESANGGSDAVRAVVRQPMIGAFVPLVLAALSVYGLVRDSMSLAWSGAVGVLVYGTLSIFGMGLYMPSLGLALVLSLSIHTVAERAISQEA
jgi:hypothetical protein